MVLLPVASSVAEARRSDLPRARTQADASRLAGAPVTLAVEIEPQAFATAEEAAKAAPDLYSSGGELVFQDGAWRIAQRFWRPIPALPVARSVAQALRAPLGAARTAKEANSVLGDEAEKVSELAPGRFPSRDKALAKWGPLIDAGLAELVREGKRLALRLSYWRPASANPHAALAARLAAPLRPAAPQAPLDIGLFEVRAPENPHVVLAEEGDGRRHQE